MRGGGVRRGSPGPGNLARRRRPGSLPGEVSAGPVRRLAAGPGRRRRRPSPPRRAGDLAGGLAVAQQELATPEHRLRLLEHQRHHPATRPGSRAVPAGHQRLAAEEVLRAPELPGRWRNQAGLDGVSRGSARAGRRGSPSRAGATRSRSSPASPARGRRGPSAQGVVDGEGVLDRHVQLPAQLADVGHPGRSQRPRRRPRLRLVAKGNASSDQSGPAPGRAARASAAPSPRGPRTPSVASGTARGADGHVTREPVEVADGGRGAGDQQERVGAGPVTVRSAS